MVQRWTADRSSCSYSVEHRSAKQIPRARYSQMEPPKNESSALLLQPLPVCRGNLVKYTKQYFSHVAKTMRMAWLPKHKRQLREL